MQILLMQSMFIAIVSDLYSDILERNNLDWERMITDVLIRKYVVGKGIFDNKKIRFLYWIQMFTDSLHERVVKKIAEKLKEWYREFKGAKKERDVLSQHLAKLNREKTPMEELKEEVQKVQSQSTELEKKVERIEERMDKILELLQAKSLDQ